MGKQLTEGLDEDLESRELLEEDIRKSFRANAIRSMGYPSYIENSINRQIEIFDYGNNRF